MTIYFIKKDCNTLECSITKTDSLEYADHLLSQGVRGLTVEARSNFAPYAFQGIVEPEYTVLNARTGRLYHRYTLEAATRLADDAQNAADVMDIRQSYIVRHNGNPVYTTHSGCYHWGLTVNKNLKAWTGSAVSRHGKVYRTREGYEATVSRKGIVKKGEIYLIPSYSRQRNSWIAVLALADHRPMSTPRMILNIS